MDDLIKICDKLEECRKKHPNYKGRIKCTEKILRSYIDGDTDKVLKLKAQLEIHRTPWDNFSAISLLISLITLVLSIFGDLLGVGTIEYKIYCMVAILFLLIFLQISSWGNTKFGYRDKWKQYIEVVLEDMEKRNDLIVTHDTCKDEN